MVFSEAGAITIGPGVTLTTDDATPNPGHYAVTTGAALTGAFVTLAPGSAVTGFEIRNTASTGPRGRDELPESGGYGSGVALRHRHLRRARPDLRWCASRAGSTPRATARCR